MTRRVVITGSGIVCPIGHDVDTMWKNLLAGNCGMAKTTTFDASTCPTTFSAEVKDFDVNVCTSDPDAHKTANRHTAFCIGATAQACAQAGIQIETDQPTDNIERRKMGIYLGAGEGAVDTDPFFNVLINAWDDDSNEMDYKKWGEYAFKHFSGMNELEQEPIMPASHIAMMTGARGPSRSCLTACAASTQAIGEAAMMIRHGKADIMIAGGAHSMIHPLGVMGFSRLTALSTRNEDPKTASRPFTASRDGFVLGEGAAIIIMETLESAKKRGANILAELVGFGSSGDAFRVTDMHEEARGAVQAIQAALKDADVSYKDIDYISTHGTSTTENDSIETKAIKTVFKEEAINTPASSPKSVFGHLIGATGCAELITCLLAIRDNTLPPTMNLNDPDPDLDLDYVPNEPRKTDVNIVMSESFGFGGQNNVLILKRFKE